MEAINTLSWHRYHISLQIPVLLIVMLSSLARLASAALEVKSPLYIHMAAWSWRAGLLLLVTTGKIGLAERWLLLLLLVMEGDGRTACSRVHAVATPSSPRRPAPCPAMFAILRVFLSSSLLPPLIRHMNLPADSEPVEALGD